MELIISSNVVWLVALPPKSALPHSAMSAILLIRPPLAFSRVLMAVKGKAEILVTALGKVGWPVNKKIGLKGLILSCGEANTVPGHCGSLASK